MSHGVAGGNLTITSSFLCPGKYIYDGNTEFQSGLAAKDVSCRLTLFGKGRHGNHTLR